MTGMSFEEIQVSLSQRRKTNYLTKRLEYDIYRNQYCILHGININTTPAFSAIDDCGGYNDQISEPTANYIIDVFKDYVNKHTEKISTAFNKVPPFPVVSADHTFNTSDRRTKEYVAGLDPEYVPSGSSSLT